MNNEPIITPLCSSSKGNAVLVSSGKTKLLIDCGISGRKLESCLSEIGVSPGEITAAAVTHEHIDHIKGIGVFSRKYSVPIYANRGTWSAMLPVIGKIADENIRIIGTGASAEIGNIYITSFPLSHDAAEPVGYVFEADGKRAAIATDTGIADEAVLSAVSGCKSALIEANYDTYMLDAGRYPYELKRRIKSDSGHLSNDAASDLAAKLISAGAEKIILGHLSEENNLPQLAYRTVKIHLESTGISVGGDAELSVANRNRAGCVLFQM